jgi:hypothetical protein
MRYFGLCESQIKKAGQNWQLAVDEIEPRGATAFCFPVLASLDEMELAVTYGRDKTKQKGT